MPKITRSFLAGKMNKVADERVLPEGEYVDAMNIRMGSTELSEQGVIENTLGNSPLTALYYKNVQLSINAVTIGSYADNTRNTIYWFVHDPSFTGISGVTKVDMILSFDVLTNVLTYHVISVLNPLDNTKTTLNFNPKYLITGVDMIGDMLFFTDDYNQPRYINVNKFYPQPNPTTNIDDALLDEMLLVIKRPPIEAPTIELTNTGDTEDNFLTDRLISFAYRYRYADGMYSATSPWSEIAFSPDNFQFSINSFLNEGMTNIYNSVNVSYFTGSILVDGIDLLFKEANKNIIKVIQKIDKSDIVPNITESFTFSNSKIFTILSEAELLRLYDNVPLKAKAQTIMGNRLMYGNYVEGYNLIDINGSQVQFDYYTELVTNEIGVDDIPTNFSTGNYSVDTVQNIANSVVNIDFTNVALKEGASVSIDFTIAHAAFTGTITPTTQTQNTQYSVDIILNNDYSSPYQFSLSQEFKNAIGTLSDIKQMSLACTGNTLTDRVNCGLPANLSGTPTVYKSNYGINILQEPIKVTSTPISNTISLQLTATKYDDSLVPPVTNYAFEYYKFINANVEYRKIASPKSLHSNRDYEVGIVYMDEFGRSTTALVSSNNTEHIPCSNSDTQNLIRVYIPTSQLPPIWATRYRFVIKSSGYNYETIYSSLAFKDPQTPYAYLLLEGENARKVEAGDRLIVKSDSNGPTSGCVYATVLEKEAKPAEFITTVSQIKPPSGVYMKMNPNDFSIGNINVFAPGEISDTASNKFSNPSVLYPMNEQDPANPGLYKDVPVPIGSRINLKFKFERLGSGDGDNNCERRIYTLEKTLISSNDYANMYDWWNGDDVALILDSGTAVVGGTGPAIGNIYYSSLFNSTLTPPAIQLPLISDYANNGYQFVRVVANNRLILYVTGTDSCGRINKQQSKISVSIELYSNTGTYIFETEPTDTLPDVFYENNLTLPITNGFHIGNVQNQTSTNSAIIDTQFFNCFAFGNGAESYKVRDSIIGKDFNFGERVTSVAQLEYREADRFADITYSGVYNEETNLNNLNQFNLGLVNYANLERSFGEIYIIDGRQTDVLVLQEDKISYVLAGKNLLSDANAGNVITATPEVLGTQIARSENFGISFNPESYVKWGYDRFFTDVKRNAVLQIRGESSQSDQLVVISEMGMRTWFRDSFIDTQNKQKLGAYDPYMNEYVLAINDNDLPVDDQCVDCGVSKTFNLFHSLDAGTYKEFRYCVDFGTNVDSTTKVTVNAQSFGTGSSYKVNVLYNGVTSSQMTAYKTNNTPSVLEFNKNSQLVETGTIIVSYKGQMVLTITTECPSNTNINVVEIIFTNQLDAGKTLHNTWQYKNGAYIGQLQSHGNIFSSLPSPTVTRNTVSTGMRGSSIFPDSGYQLTMGTEKVGGDNFNFDPTINKLKYVMNPSQLSPSTILSNLSSYPDATPIIPSVQGATAYKGTFTIPTTDDYLHLIWDLRKAYIVYLCYGDEESLPKEVGCDCNKCTICYNIKFTKLNEDSASIYFPIGSKCGEINEPTIETLSGGEIALCIPTQDWYIYSGDVKVEFQYCSDVSCSCASCRTYSLNDNAGYDTDIQYTDCITEDVITLSANDGSNELWCAKEDTFFITNVDGSPFGFAESSGCGCCPDPNNQCVTYRLVTYSDGDLEYTDCAGDNVSEFLFGGTIKYFCGSVLNSPTFSAEHILVVHNPCGCYT